MHKLGLLAVYVTFLLCHPLFSFGQDRVPLIINGERTAEFPAVGIVGERSVGGFCTGTLITPTHVLTAAHCAEAILDFGSENSGTFEVDGRLFVTSSIHIHPQYNSRTFSNDVAILVLTEPIEGIAPLSLNTRSPQVGELVTMIGFGGQGSPSDGTDNSFGEKLIGFATIDGVTDSELFWLFDDASESNSAPGDSGGPVFVTNSGEFQVAGIVSSGTSASAALGDTTFCMRIDAYLNWIDETVLATSAVDPLPVVPADPSPIPAGDDPVPTDPPQLDSPADAPAAPERPSPATIDCPNDPTVTASSDRPKPGLRSPGSNRRRGTYRKQSRNNPRRNGNRRRSSQNARR